ncbi:MAG: molybdopterin molybdotransferase MoeA [Clostridia bacterium]|nr:molybdopterin molybdotransferase MoeA [Clostridia bacterium]MDQ7791609.1 molybdopterin molybdotransferase MoeA [Clostridia bacterium]
MNLFRALTIEQALEILRAHIRWAPQSEEAGLVEALGRVLERDVTAPEDVPGFDRSTMDGFAVRAQDTFGATEGLPAYLDIIGEVLMGSAPGGSVSVGQAYRIATGGMLPAGTDAVVMVEYTEQLDEHTIGVTRPVAPGDNTVRRGDDITRGALLLTAGRRLRAQDVGLLAAAGVSRVSVVRPPRVGVITTGDEVVPVDAALAPGQVRDVNSYTNGALVEVNGGVARRYGVVGDDFELLSDTVRLALTENNAVVISGGSSVGKRDFTADVINNMGKPGVLFHGLAVRPGKPTIGAVVDGKPLIGLPGHPVSAMVVFELIVKPLINPTASKLSLRARITRSLSSPPGKEDYVRVALSYVDGVLTAEPILGKSSLIVTMVRADGLARIPLESQGVSAGEEVEVIPF